MYSTGCTGITIVGASGPFGTTFRAFGVLVNVRLGDFDKVGPLLSAVQDYANTVWTMVLDICNGSQVQIDRSLRDVISEYDVEDISVNYDEQFEVAAVLDTSVHGTTKIKLFLMDRDGEELYTLVQYKGETIEETMVVLRELLSLFETVFSLR